MPSASSGKLDQPAKTQVRIVLDTNVVLSALLWCDTPHHLLEPTTGNVCSTKAG